MPEVFFISLRSYNMTEIIIAVLLFVAGLVLIVKCGDYFVDAAVWIAEVSGIPKFIVGATVVSIATTLPELLVSVIAAAGGDADGIAIATGNAVGSVTANTGLILAVSIICIPAVVKRKQYAFKALLLIFVTAVLWGFSFFGVFPNNELSYIGSAILLIAFGVFVYENIKEAKSSLGSDEVQKPAHDKKTVTVNILKFILGIAGIVVGAKLLVDNATVLAAAIGIPAAVISATIVAIGTSLPELVTTVTAIIKKESSLSVGNIIGANIIDIAIILPICSFLSGRPLPVSPQNLIIDMPVCLFIISLAVIPMLIRGKFSRLQGILLLLFYIAYIVLISAFLEPVLGLFI